MSSVCASTSCAGRVPGLPPRLENVGNTSRSRCQNRAGQPCTLETSALAVAVRLQPAAHLVGPTAVRIERQVGAPVPPRLVEFAGASECLGEVVVRIGVV